MSATHKRSALQNIAIDKLHRGRYQPRRQFDAEQLAELAQSIQSAGLLQPLVVRPLREDEYEIIAGERRWRAAQLAGLDEISCLVREFTDEQAAEAAAIENLNRVDLNPIEEARAYQRLIDEFGYLHEELAAAVGKSRVKITNSLRLLRLDPRVQDMLIKGQIKDGHGKAIAGLPQSHQQQIAYQCAKNGWSVRKVEQAVRRLQNELKQKTHNPIHENVNHKALERKLSDHIGCPVSIEEDNGKGCLRVSYQNVNVLQGLLDKMGFDIDK